MVLAAQLGALAAVHAGLLDAGPRFIDEAGNGVLLPAQRRHPPGMDHVVGGDDEAHLGIHRQHQPVVHVQQVMRMALAGRHDAALPHAVGLTVQAAGEGDVLAEVFVLPHPLVAGDLHRHLGIAGVVHLDQVGRGRPCHHDQDDHRDHRPDHLGLGVVAEGGGHRALGFAELEDGVGHRPEHDDADHRADDQRQVVRLPGQARGLGHPLAHVQLPRLGIGRLGPCQCRNQSPGHRGGDRCNALRAPPAALLHCLDP
ncbi:hypothetical protein G6F57_014658 [Rhizopus arrhizus]|nr:hypothetical protein G6F65_018663 [Rhizopus arrhizus]KAG1458653.1 hypothetical protein G6F57_014658 [Rhizopus arrhizus]